MTIQKLRKAVDSKIAIRQDLGKRVDKIKTRLNEAKQKELDAKKTQLILQQVAKQTQEQLEYRISELVSLSLAAVFPNPYKMRLIYEMKYNKTEAQLVFERDGNIIDPLSGGGYGPVDIASFALRCSLWSLKNKELDNVIIMDEPFKNINDPTRKLHRNAALMLKEISERIGVQFILTSQIPELEEVADTVFSVKMINNVSEVTEV